MSDVGTQLNQVPTDPGGGGGNGGGAQGPYLASTPAEKKKAAKSIEDTVEPGTRRAGALADEATDAAVKAFSAKDGDGWMASGALKAAHEAWGNQVQALLTRLGGEKESLRATNTLLSGTDFQIGAGSQRVPSPLDGY
ncbi:hypothetical protein JS756_10775 [Streptomyces actuosus]|uniref:WXG100 family type VII secretion target n=1 Tax=Streptomyces actuosus TaxID=1885 RepID=A0ABS2VNF4_STRAS|nr:hypothetical protein [Streptomyces actuosus]MBN0044585.1 hypothetical protein [Streptomyces actuosus]